MACLDKTHQPGLCTPCQRSLETAQHPCFQCGLPMPRRLGPETPCGDCLRHHPAFDHTQAGWLYRFPIDALITRYKYGKDRSFAWPLVQLMGEQLRAYLAEPDTPRPDLLVPVPMHPRKQRQRGFNQAEDIAEYWGRTLGIPWSAEHLHRSRATAAQSGLDRKSRRRNLRQAFVVSRPPPAHITLVDDVMTTGSTAHEIASTFKAAGAKRVDVWVLARTPP
ncbi:MAG: ComF family protein [Marinobacter sp.]|nr:ComF family protein [Marinobacter sp.]